MQTENLCQSQTFEKHSESSRDKQTRERIAILFILIILILPLVRDNQNCSPETLSLVRNKWKKSILLLSSPFSNLNYFIFFFVQKAFPSGFNFENEKCICSTFKKPLALQNSKTFLELEFGFRKPYQSDFGPSDPFRVTQLSNKKSSFCIPTCSSNYTFLIRSSISVLVKKKLFPHSTSHE